MKKNVWLWGFLVGGVLSLTALAAADLPPVGLATLAGVDHLWHWTGQVQTAMSSSTDPTGANADLSQFHGSYRGEPILLKTDGPGCVYRIWSARPSGVLKIYFDGSSRPELVCSFKSYLKGTCAGLPGEFALGRAANYMPIPYAKSILITAPGFTVPGYYQISYQTYDPAVPVRSFQRSAAGADPALPAARAIWTQGPLAVSKVELKSAQAVSEAGGAAVLRLSGAGVIRSLSVRDRDRPADALEGLRLKITWDDQSAPAVDVPLEAFFLNRFDLKTKRPGGALKTMFVSAGADGYAAGFPMPFGSRAVIEVVNPGPARRLELSARWEQLDALPPGALRFHAFYRSQDYETDLDPAKIITFRTPVDPATNYVVLDRAGRGQYVGCAIFVASAGTMWWGEGDEMTYIDGAAKPQIQGTGTEDEFNWSWGFTAYLSPLSGTLPVVPKCDESIAAQIIPQLRNPECNKIIGHNIAFRFRPSDYVPFAKSLKVSYEVLGASWAAPHSILVGNLSQLRGDDYSSIAYWYEEQ